MTAMPPSVPPMAAANFLLHATSEIRYIEKKSNSLSRAASVGGWRRGMTCCRACCSTYRRTYHRTCCRTCRRVCKIDGGVVEGEITGIVVDG